MPAFDPYYKWLGIPPEEQPPNHYRLLGINLFEADAAVISNAADQRMAFLKSVQTGEHVQHSQDLLNQVAQAKLCLLDAGKRRAYDATLGDRQTAFLKKDQDRSRPQPTSGPGTVPPKYAVDAGDSMRRGAPPRTLSGVPPRQSLFSRIPSWALVAVVSGALVLVVSVLLRPGTESPDPPDGDWQQERDELLAKVARLGDLVEQRNRESQVRIQDLEQERDESLADVKRLRELVKQRDRELQRLKDNTEPPPESLVANLKVGLVAYYPFNGNAKDESGNGNDGEVHGGAKLGQNRHGNPNSAYILDGKDDYISALHKPYLNFPSGNLTISMWTTIQNRNAPILFIGKSTGGGLKPKWIVHFGSPTGKALSFHVYPPHNSFSAPTNLRLPQVGWHHYLVTKNGSRHTIYVKGIRMSQSDGVPDLPTNNSAPLTIGQAEGLGWVNGSIDDVRIYNRALSAEEVKALYDHESTPPDITVSKPKPPPTPPKMSRAQRVLAAPIKKHMTPKQEDLGGPVVNSIDIVLVPIPAGEFMMGSPESEAGRDDDETQHKVRITKPFYLSAHEVTQAQYEQVIGKTPSNSKGDDKPVTNVNWHEAVAFCHELSKQEGKDYRLPTEAQWEYACRAGTMTAYSFGDDVSQLGEYAWFGSNSGDTTHRVGEKPSNEWGLFDMHGNVSEWCQDWYGGYETEQVLVDPKGPASGSRRVLRGGALVDPAMIVRAANRITFQPGNGDRALGFRVARTYDISPAVTVPKNPNDIIPIDAPEPVDTDSDETVNNPDNEPTDLSTVVIDGKWYSPDTKSTILFKQQNQIVDVTLVNGRNVSNLTGRLRRNGTNLNAENWSFIVRGDPKQTLRNGTFVGTITATRYIKAEITWLRIDKDGNEVKKETTKVSYIKVRE